jgi:hypothetical protein
VDLEYLEGWPAGQCQQLIGIDPQVVGQKNAGQDIRTPAGNVASMLATSSSIRISGNGDAQRWLREVTTEVLTDCFEHQKALAEIRRQQLAEKRMPLGVATECVLRFEWKIPPASRPFQNKPYY